MTDTRIRDLIGGGLVVAVGAFIALYAVAHYSLGSFSNMGPGMLPLLLGSILVLLGVAIAAMALRQDAVEPIDLEIRVLVAVAVAIGGFAVTVTTIGLLPAVLVLTLACAAADGRPRPTGVVVLGTVLFAMVYGIFTLGLGVEFPIVKWGL